jgi:transposase
MKQRFAGIDVGSRELVVWLDGRSEPERFSNDAEGHVALVRWLRRARPVRVCLEASGIYHLDAALALHRSRGIEVMVANPAATRDFARALLQRSKTDPTDAHALLEFARRMPFVAWQPPAPTVLDLRAICRRIATLTVERTQERNRLHAAEHQAELTSAIAGDIESHLEHLEQSMARLQAAALELVQHDARLTRRLEQLVSVRGIATASALRILAELEVLPEDMTARQWVAHAGLDPRHVESGTSVHRPTRISKTGNKHLRAALYIPALVAVREDPRVRAFYEDLLARGKKPIQALVAVERKLLVALHAMIRTDTNFDSSRFRATA